MCPRPSTADASPNGAAGTDPADRPGPPARRFAWWLWLVWAVYAGLLAANLSAHEMWRDELQAFGLARSAGDPVELLTETIRYEGHPGGYHLLIWLVTRIWDAPAVVKVLNWAACVAAVGLILRFAPFRPGWRAAVCFGYVWLYEWGAISRVYALTGLLAIGALALHPWHGPRRWWAAAGLLVLLCQTTAYGVLLAVGLAVAMGLSVQPAGPKRKVWANPRLAGLVALLAVSAALAAVQALPPADRHAVPGGPRADLATLVAVSAGAFEALVPMPHWGPGFWRQHALLRLFWPWSALLAGALAAAGWGLLIWRFRRKTEAVAVLAIVLAGTLTIGLAVLPGDRRHWAHAWLAVLAAWWLGRNRGLDPLGADQSSPSAAAGRALLVASLTLHAAAGLVATTAEQVWPFSRSRQAAEMVRRRVEPNDVLLAWPDAICSAVVIRLDRPAWYLNADRAGSWIRWDRARRQPGPADLLDAADRYGQSDAPVWLLVGRDLPPAALAAGWRPVADATGPAAVGEERYRLYRLGPPAKGQAN